MLKLCVIVRSTFLKSVSEDILLKKQRELEIEEVNKNKLN